MAAVNRSRISKRIRPVGIDFGNAQLALSHHSGSENQNYAFTGHFQVQQSPYHPLSPQHQVSPTNYFSDVYESEPGPLPSHYHLAAQQMMPVSYHQQYQQNHELVQRFQFNQHHQAQTLQSVPTQRFTAIQPAYEDSENESQESKNEDTMKSEAVEPALEGFPNVDEFDALMASYVSDLSVKKQDKALIHARRARNIKQVLLDQKDTTIESAQFRFWVKKMFTLEPAIDSVPLRKRRVCHEGKPVAVREKLFKILTNAHQQCQHGGRDKTSGQVRRKYSWVPKELISRFVKICPTCQLRRGGSSRLATPPRSTQNSPPPEEPAMHSPKMLSPPESRRDSMIQRHPRFHLLQVQCPNDGGVVNVSPFQQQQQQGYSMLDATVQQHARAATLAAQNMILNSIPVNGSMHGSYSDGVMGQGQGSMEHHRGSGGGMGHSAVDDRHHMDIEEDEFQKAYGGDYGGDGGASFI